MLTPVLAQFPHTPDPLTLVHDPDHLLADDGLRQTLTERGLTLLEAEDVFRLRQRVREEGGGTASRPLVIITPQPLNQLPYDLWQPAHKIELHLQDLFPHLHYPLVQELSLTQWWQLAHVPGPDRPLLFEPTARFLLYHLFGLSLPDLHEPATWLAWLNRYHEGTTGLLPPRLTAFLVQTVQAIPTYQQWPVAELLRDRSVFTGFVQNQWQTYIQQTTEEKQVQESRSDYLLPFAHNRSLQDTLPQLLRTGSLQPIPLAGSTTVPAWAKIAVLRPDENVRGRRFQEIMAELNQRGNDLTNADWARWQEIALTWAGLTLLRYHPPDHDLSDEQIATYHTWQARLDDAFATWLPDQYTRLAVKKLPLPHHLFHVPDYLAFLKRTGRVERVALLVLDGLALADWLLLAETWRARRPSWQWEQQLLLAQIPSITAISRQALISGLRPAEFADSLGYNRQESKLWAQFWQRQGLGESSIAYDRLNLEQAPTLDLLRNQRLQAICLVNSKVDEMMHHATLGTADLQASFYLWLKEQVPRLEEVITSLLGQGVTVFLTSDHGHTEALGMGQPNEGVLVPTRSKRARVYDRVAAANRVQTQFPATIQWANDGLLPAEMAVIIADRQAGQRQAFATAQTTVVSHGGITLDELVVPLIRLQLKP